MLMPSPSAQGCSPPRSRPRAFGVDTSFGRCPLRCVTRSSVRSPGAAPIAPVSSASISSWNAAARMSRNDVDNVASVPVRRAARSDRANSCVVADSYTHVMGLTRDLVRDATTWIELGTYEPDELAIRFHHRMVAIHPFPNGNGRHGRIAADYLVTSLGHPAFTWGSRLEVDTDELRSRYIEALHDAGDGDISGLIEFARN